MITKIQLKEIIHRKYDWILDDLKSHDKIAMVTSKLLQGIDICLKKKHLFFKCYHLTNIPLTIHNPQIIMLTNN